jgi:hypothetical protein
MIQPSEIVSTSVNIHKNLNSEFYCQKTEAVNFSVLTAFFFLKRKKYKDS